MHRPPKLSVVIVAQDEADRIEDTVLSAIFADEVLVVDGGSTDDTAALAVAVGARVAHIPWRGHTAQKAAAIREAAHPWVFLLDADEQISEALAHQVRAAIAHPDAGHGYRVPRTTFWLGAPIRYGTWSPDARVRLFRAASAEVRGPDPHDRVCIEGSTGALNEPLIHHAYRDLGDHLATIARYAVLQARALSGSGPRARLWHCTLRPLAHLVRALVLKQGWRDGPRGAAVAFLGAAHVALKWSLVALHQQGHLDLFELSVPRRRP